MKLYHYTSLATLALILKNRTIMFNRLDKVDDVEEGTINTQAYSSYIQRRNPNVSRRSRR